MSKAKLVITAITVQGLSQAEAARTYGLSQAWVSRLMARYRDEGEGAYEPRSRRPKTSPNATPATTVALVLRLRQELVTAGLDAGAETIAWHLEHHHQTLLPRATIHRILTRHGLVTPEPKKKPKSALHRFEASMPNECWQSDFTHYRLTTGLDVEILTWLDDCTRYAINVTAHRAVTAIIVRDTFREAVTKAGIPASTLTDNGMVFPPTTPSWEVPPPPGSPAVPVATPSRTSSAASTSSSRTAEPTTPPPRAKSNDSNKP